MALQTVLLNAGLSGMADITVEVSLHSSDPGASGTNEVDGGSYERQPVSWNAPTAASVSADSILTFEIPGGGTVVSWVGLWDPAGLWLGGIELNASETFEGDGQFAVTSLTISAANA